MARKRKKYACDFEATTKIDDCRVWGYGFMEIGNTDNFFIGHELKDFMSWAIHAQADLYFHNLKYDGSFIINWLMRNGWTFSKEKKPNTFNVMISGMGQWYSIDICVGYKGRRRIHTVIYDSLKKLPFKVSEIAKGFKLGTTKGDIDYHKERPPGYVMDDDERFYIMRDIKIMAESLHVQFQQGLTKITNGSDSLSGFKTIVSKKMFDKLFPVFSIDVDKAMRDSYKGGFTWLNERYYGKRLHEGIVFDVNSLYPAMMYDKPLPYGEPLFFTGEYEFDEEYPLYIQHMRCEFFLKENHIPTIQVKNNLSFQENEYLKSSDGEHVELWVSSVDLELIKEHYDLYNVEYYEGWKFKQRTGIFTQFIDKWTYVKTHEEGAKRLIAKLMLNSLYGKFGTNPDVTGKVPVLNDDMSNRFEVGEEEFRDPIYLPMAVFITSYAREYTIRTAQKCYDRIIYCDTDSIHLIGAEVPEAIKDIVDENQLGYWAYEGTFKQAKYLRQKTYMQELYAKEVEKDGETKLKECPKDEATTTKISVKCAGMTPEIKKKVTFENFKVGFSSGGKLQQKQVPGGAVLVDRVFTIK